MKYRVCLTAQASVSTSVEVEAENENVAADLAVKVAERGDVTWNYDGVDDSTIEPVDFASRDEHDAARRQAMETRS
jgi:hypothetical protein